MHFCSKNFYVILFFTLQIFYNIFWNFQKFTPKEIFALKFFFAKIKFLTQYQSKFFCNVLLKTFQISNINYFILVRKIFIWLDKYAK